MGDKGSTWARGRPRRRPSRLPRSRRPAAERRSQDDGPKDRRGTDPGDLHPRLDEFAASLKAADALLVLRDSTLDGLPASLTGIKLISVTPSGRQIETTKGPLKVILDEITTLYGYGTEVTGAKLANDFAAPPYGASLEVLQAIVAAGVRTGLLDVRYQGALIKNPGDQRLDAVFKGPAAFRSASFRPHEDVVPPENALSWPSGSLPSPARR